MENGPNEVGKPKKHSKSRKNTQNPWNCMILLRKTSISYSFRFRIGPNPAESPLLNLHRGGGRKCPIFKSRYLREYLIFFIKIFFIVKLWIYSIDSARLRPSPSYFENRVIIPTWMAGMLTRGSINSQIPN